MKTRCRSAEAGDRARHVAHGFRCAQHAHALHRQADEGPQPDAGHCRVNRVHKDKPGGLVVDYLGIAADLKKALSFYTDAGGKGDPVHRAGAGGGPDAGEGGGRVGNMYHGFPTRISSRRIPREKLSLILRRKSTSSGWKTGASATSTR
jgi:hypothetical protein